MKPAGADPYKASCQLNKVEDFTFKRHGLRILIAGRNELLPEFV